jgi:hypothetical protein
LQWCMHDQHAGLDAKRATNICIALCNMQVSPLRRQRTPPPVEMTKLG